MGFGSVDFAPPAPPLDLSSSTPVSQFVFVRAPSGWYGDWHPAPRRFFFCLLAGELEVTASDGETRLLLPGDVGLVEDTTGKGHKSKVTSERGFNICNGAVSRLNARAVKRMMS